MAEPVLIEVGAIQSAQFHPPIWRIWCCSAGSLLEAGRPSGTKSWARRVPVPIARLRSSLRRSGSIFIVFEVIAFGYGREESVMSTQSRYEPPDLDLYYLRPTLHYIWPRWAPHRPGWPAQSLSWPCLACQAGQMACLLGALFDANNSRFFSLFSSRFTTALLF